MDEFTEVSSQGWLSRLGESIKGVVVGLVLFIIAFPVLWWNEGRAVQTTRSLEEGEGAVVSVSADAVDSGNEGALVHLTGEATTDEVLADPTFGVSATAIQLSRQVEMYQWEEDEDRETRKKMGGGEETVTTYSYRKTWSPSAISSSSFHEPSGHENPGSMPWSSESWQATDVTLGAFQLSAGLVSDMSRFEPLRLDAIPSGAPDRVHAEGSLNDGGVYVGANPGSPAIGDLKIAFRQVSPATVSIIAAQVGSDLTRYQTKAGDALEMLSYGTQTADLMFQAAHQANTIMTWALRGLGFLLMAIGIGLVFKPLTVMADVIPLLGDILGFGLGLFAAVVAASLSLVTIAVAWIAYRPILGGALLAGAIALFVVPKLLGRGRAKAAA